MATLKPKVAFGDGYSIMFSYPINKKYICQGGYDFSSAEIAMLLPTTQSVEFCKSTLFRSVVVSYLQSSLPCTCKCSKVQHYHNFAEVSLKNCHLKCCIFLSIIADLSADSGGHISMIFYIFQRMHIFLNQPG